MRDLLIFIEDKKYYIISIFTVIFSLLIYVFFLFKVPYFENKFAPLFGFDVFYTVLMIFTFCYGVLAVWKWSHGQKIKLRIFFFFFFFFIALSIKQGLVINHYEGLMSIHKSQIEQK